MKSYGNGTVLQDIKVIDTVKSYIWSKSCSLPSISSIVSLMEIKVVLGYIFSFVVSSYPPLFINSYSSSSSYNKNISRLIYYSKMLDTSCFSSMELFFRRLSNISKNSSWLCISYLLLGLSSKISKNKL